MTHFIVKPLKYDFMGAKDEIFFEAGDYQGIDYE